MSRPRIGFALALAAIFALMACGGTTATSTPAPSKSAGASTAASASPAPSKSAGASTAASASSAPSKSAGASTAPCAKRPDTAATNRTHAQLPNCAARYDQYEGETITHVATLGLNLFSAVKGSQKIVFAVEQPEVVTFLLAIQYGTKFAECAQEKGIANWRLYIPNGGPGAAGIVLIASDKQLKAQTALCVLESIAAIQSPSSPPPLSPCADRFSYKAEGDTFYVVYAATRQDLCQDFRTSFGR